MSDCGLDRASDTLLLVNTEHRDKELYMHRTSVQKKAFAHPKKVRPLPLPADVKPAPVPPGIPPAVNPKPADVNPVPRIPKRGPLPPVPAIDPVVVAAPPAA